MGGAKHLVRVGGKHLIEHAIDAAHQAGLEPVPVVKPETDLAPLGGALRVLVEPAQPRHPLAGILAALEQLGKPVVVCPCDLPLIPGPLLAHLASLPDRCAVIAVGGSVQPLLGRYSPGTEADLRNAIDGEHSAVEAVLGLDARLIEGGELREFGDPARIISNVNTPVELSLIEDELGAD